MSIEHIIVTGYSGTGSSAVLDLLSEFSSCKLIDGKYGYEDFFFTAPNSLFDLEWKLLYNNDPHRSDEAISAFLKTVNWLYNTDIQWALGYKRIIGDKLLIAVKKFVETIATDDGVEWYYRYKTVSSSIIYFFRLLGNRFYKKNIDVHHELRFVDKSPVYVSMPTEEEFFLAARILVKEYLMLISHGEKITVHDHVIWPTQVSRVDKYFDGNIKFIMVARDARDMFCLNKYYWVPNGSSANLPLDPRKFADHWNRLMQNTLEQNNKRVMVVYFEDLVYNYGATTSAIINLCELKQEMWTNRQTKFMPQKSINNTQFFMQNELYYEEAEIIQNSIPEFCYRYPYSTKTDAAKMFI